MQFDKFFTLKEANALVPELLEAFPKIQDLAHSLNHDFPDVQQAQKNAKFNGGSSQGGEYLNHAFKLTSLTRKLEEQGIIIKGLDAGLADFPNLRDGKEVFLCWKFPEKEIRFWHDIDSGFAGRQEL